jgi:hypothetical protein
MKSPNDISGLFKMLGENPEHYQEIVRDADARKSRERWPLLAAIQASETTQQDPAISRSSNDLPRRHTQAPVIAKRYSATEQSSAMPYRKLPNQLTSLFSRLSVVAPNQDLPSTQKKTSVFERLIR